MVRERVSGNASASWATLPCSTIMPAPSSMTGPMSRAGSSDQPGADRWALVDWDNTIRPGFVLIDWVRFLAGRGLAASNAARMLEEVDRARDSRLSYNEFAAIIISIYKEVEEQIDERALLREAEYFVESERPFLIPESVGMVALPTFHSLGLRVHVISGSPSIILEQYRERYSYIDQVSGISSDDGTDLVAIKTVKSQQYREDGLAQFALGDSESDLPLFESARFPIGVNLSCDLFDKRGGLNIETDKQLKMSAVQAKRLRDFITSHSTEAGE